MSLSKTLYPLLSTGSTRKDLILKIVDWDVKNQSKQHMRFCYFLCMQSANP